jgi:hypothetical protein
MEWKTMRRRMNLQGQRAVQLEMFAKDRLRPANDDDWASAPGPTRSVFNGVLDHRGEQETKLIRLGLTLHDCIARSGPADAYSEQE